MTRTARLLALGAAAVLGLAGTATASGTTDAAEAPTARYNLANEGTDCGAGDAPFLTTEARTTDRNCGYVGGGLPFGEAFHVAGQESGRTFATKGLKPGESLLVADADRDAAGVVVVRNGSQQGVALPGGGQVVADIAMRVRVGRTTLDLGSQTLDGVVRPGSGSISLPFSFDLPDALAGAAVDGVEVDLNVRGVHLFHGFMHLNGNTYVDVPTVVAEPVEVTAP